MIQRTIDPMGRLTIPKAFRESLGLEIGEPVDIDMNDGQIILTNPARTDKIYELIERFEGTDDLYYSGNDIAYILRQEFNR